MKEPYEEATRGRGEGWDQAGRAGRGRDARSAR